jgi:hypothetical protein
MEELTDLQVVKPQEWDEEIELAPDEDALEFLEKVMRDPRQPMARRMRAAEKRADILYPKKAAVAMMSMDEHNFAAQLDRAIERSGMMKLLGRQDEGAQPPPLPPHGTPRQGPTTDRRFRRG